MLQGMLDFDHVCRRDIPSVVAMIYPFSGNHKQKFYWGQKEIMIPGEKNVSDTTQTQASVLLDAILFNNYSIIICYIMCSESLCMYLCI